MIILNQNVPLTTNVYYALQRYRIFWLLLCLTAALDYITTLNFMIHGDISMEANLIIRQLAYQFGIFEGVFIGKVLQLFSGLAFCALSRNLSRTILLLLILLNSLAIYINTV